MSRFWRPSFLGLEMERAKTGINVHQSTFINELLFKYGFEKCNGIQSVTMEAPVDEDPPDADELRTLQCYVGELNWLSTRSRADLSYMTSLISSCLKKYPKWAARLWKKVMRYLRATADAGLFLPEAGDEGLLDNWSDAGFAGVWT